MTMFLALPFAGRCLWRFVLTSAWAESSLPGKRSSRKLRSVYVRRDIIGTGYLAIGVANGTEDFILK